MKKSLLFLILIVFFQLIFAQNKSPMYSGGMLFFQPGYTITSNPNQEINSLGFGIGGLLRFYIKDHFTLGLIGGSQKTGYVSTQSENSYINLGYGGVFAGYTYFGEKFRFCIALSGGKGRIKNIHIEEQSGTEIISGNYYTYPVWVAYPMLSVDYYLSKKISLTTQVICLSTLDYQNDLYFCPVFQLGILFNR